MSVPLVTRTARVYHGPMKALLRGHPLALGALFGVVDAVWTMAHGSTGAGVFTAIIGVWLLTAWAIGTAWRGAWALALGRGGFEHHRAGAQAWCRRAWYEEDLAEDRRRGAHLAGWVAGFVVWLVGSVALLAYLIEHRHGPWLIAVTHVLGQLFILALAIWAGLGKARTAPLFLTRLGLGPPRWRTLLTGLIGVGAAGLAIGLALGWRVIEATDAVSLIVLPGSLLA
ncbi:MAG: hypothetical protein QF464_15605, partial [Myxococcota bacterium]|nr:hypothetical protein [Myxococcota bacterium]